MQIKAPPRVYKEPVLDLWFRDVYAALIALPNDVYWTVSAGDLTQVTSNQDINLGTGDVTCGDITSSSITASTITDGTATITGGVISGASIAPSQITQGHLNLGTGDLSVTNITATGWLNVSSFVNISSTLDVAGAVTLSSTLDVDSAVTMSSTCAITGNTSCADLDCEDITATSITI